MKQQILFPQIQDLAVIIKLTDGTIHQVACTNDQIIEISAAITSDKNRVEILADKIEGIEIVPPAGHTAKCTMTGYPLIIISTYLEDKNVNT